MDIIISANVESPGKQNVMLTKRCYFVFFNYIVPEDQFCLPK